MIGIIGAMECEVALLIEKMNNKSSQKVGKQTFWVGNISGCECVVTRCGAGLVNAATAAVIMAAHFSPSAIVNVGVGGGLAPDLDIGDMVIARTLCCHDLDYGILGDVRGTIFYPDGEEIRLLPTDERVSLALLNAARDAGFRCREGVIASGDLFVSSSEKRADIREAFGADICEMEGAAIAQALYSLGVPYAVLRSVSDRADGDAPASFEHFAVESAERAAAVLMTALEKL